MGDEHHADSFADSRANLLGVILSEKYEIIQLIGQGGMGTVYKSIDLRSGALRAIKILNFNLIEDVQALRRFQMEAEAVTRIEHPNAISIVDAGMVSSKQPFLVMEYVDGISLLELVAKAGPQSISKSIRIFVQICDALSAAHRKGVIHRDIKPSNVMLTNPFSDSCSAKVVDFGIAKVFYDRQGSLIETATGDVFGSPPYMSPEQCMGQKLDRRSDIYSLGCLMYEVLSGAPPFSGNSPMSTMYRHLNEAPRAYQNPDEDIRLVHRVNQIIQKSLDKNADKRYQSTIELSEDLRTAVHDAAQAVAFFSLLQGKFFEYWRLVHNSIGSSKRPLVFVLLLTSIGICLGSFLLLPTAFLKYPSGAELKLRWRALPKLLDYNQELNVRNENRRRKLVRLVEEYGTANGTKASPESMSLHKQLGDIYFIEQFYNLASPEYYIVIKQGLQLFTSSYSSYQAPPAFVHDIGVSYLRMSQCALQLGDVSGALFYSKAGLNWSFSDSDIDSSYKAYFAQVIAVSSIKLTHQMSTQSVEYLDKFTKYIDLRKQAGIEAGRAANAVSQVADCYIDLGCWEKAIEMLKRARQLWLSYESPEAALQTNRILISQRPGAVYLMNKVAVAYAQTGKCGPYNAAVASEKMGLAYVHLGDFMAADLNLEQACSQIESLLGRDEPTRALVLFERANELWKSGNYFKSIEVKIEAQKIWSNKARN